MFSFTLVSRQGIIIVMTHEKGEAGLVRIDNQRITRDLIRGVFAAAGIAKTLGRIDSSHNPCRMGIST